jgi:hypothetical protein
MRAKPVFRMTLLAAALAAASGAHALGLGRLTVESSLGQPLSARIELTSASRDELDTLTARVADPSLYRQNNMQFQPRWRARASPSSRAGGAYPARHLAHVGRRAVPRPRRRGGMGLGPRRAQLHVPARSAGRPGPGAGRAGRAHARHAHAAAPAPTPVATQRRAAPGPTTRSRARNTGSAAATRCRRSRTT